MTQAQAVIETIEALGGIATLTQINQKIVEIEDCEKLSFAAFDSLRENERVLVTNE